MSGNDNNDTKQFLQKLLEACGEKQQLKLVVDQETQPPISSWMDELVARLLQSETCDQMLQLVVALVQVDPAKYLLPLSKSVAAKVANEKPVHVSDSLLQVWISQMVFTDQVSVHTNLSEALVLLVVKQNNLTEPAMTQLVQVWKMSSQDNNDKKQASILAVRCATVVIQCIDKLGDAAFHIFKQLRATDSIVEMIRDSSDPLMQLSVLDLFPQYMHQQQTIQIATREWLEKDLAKPCIEFLEDPLLSGAALQFLGLVSSSEMAQQALLGHVREMGTITSESERLQVVHALAQVANYSNHGLQLILEDATLRSAWWGELSRLSSPKLQAAILSSVRMLLERDSAKPHGMKMFTCLGRDNNNDFTNIPTQWLFSRYCKSPMPELRIASYGILEQVAGLPGGTNLLATCSDFMEWMLQGQREATSDARVAKFELIQAFYQNAQGFLASELSVKLKKIVEMGPHGQVPQRWDVAME